MYFVSYNIEKHGCVVSGKVFAENVSDAALEIQNKLEGENCANSKCNNETQRDIPEVYKIVNVLSQPKKIKQN